MTASRLTAIDASANVTRRWRRATIPTMSSMSNGLPTARNAPARTRFLENFGGAVRGHQDDRGRRAPGAAERRSRAEIARVRQLQIEQHHTDVVRAVVEADERLPGRARLERPRNPSASRLSRDGPADQRFVVDDQDCSHSGNICSSAGKIPAPQRALEAD